MEVLKEGFSYSFNQEACLTCEGNCCIGESGAIFVDEEEIKNISKALNLTIEEFIKHFLVKIKYKYSIKEKLHESGYACLFFDDEKKQCKIYHQRPKQCRTFPFWEYFKTRKHEVLKECPGIKLL